LPHHEGEEELA